ncbi:MAG: Ser-Thr-rich GPI-anchored membrane family protein, partial [Acidobacteriota bacterium]
MVRTFLSLCILLLLAFPCFAQNDKPLIYVCYNREESPDDALIILDAMTLTEVGRIPLENAFPDDIVVRGDKKIAFVSADPRFKNSTGFSIVDLVQQKRIRTMLTGTVLQGVEIGPKGILYVLARPGQLFLFDPQTFQMLQMVNLPDDPLSIIFSKDEKKAFVTISGGTELVVLDLDNNLSLIKSITVPDGSGDSSRQALSPDGRRLYVAGRGTIAVIDTDRMEIVDSLPGTRNTFAIQLSKDGKTLYASDFFSAPPLIAIDTASRTIIKTFNIIGQTRFLTLSPDGQLLYANNIGNFFYIIDTKTNIVLTPLRYAPGSDGFSGGIAVTGDFSIGTAPTVQVISPQLNEIVQRGKPFTIRWQTTSGGFVVSTHIIELSTDGGQNFSTIMFADDLFGTAQEFQWNVPNQIINNARIRITALDVGGRVGTKTSEIFSIGDRPPDPVDNQPPTVRFLNPLGGERFNQGDNLTITWSSSDNVRVTSQDLTLSTDGGNTFPNTIATGLDGATQSFAFTIPTSIETTRARLRLIVRDAANNMAQTITPADFQIQPVVVPDTQAPTITISNPTAGQVLPAGQSITVNWQSTDNVGVASQSLLLSLDGGATFQNVADFAGNVGTFTINNLDKATANARVKIAATDAAGNKGEQVASFMLMPMIIQPTYNKPTLSITGVGFTSSTPQATTKVLING